MNSIRHTTVRSAADIPALGTVLGVWAHPDDETYLSAGLMAAAADAGQRVVVVTATRGEAGTDDPLAWPPDRLAAARVAELAASLAVLDGARGAIEHRFLGERGDPPRRFSDGTLAQAPRRARRAAVDELARVIAEVGPDSVLTFGPDGMTGHADHRTVSAWATAAFRLAAPAGARLLYATLTAEAVGAFQGLVDPLDDADDVPSVTPVPELAVDLRLAGRDLDRKVTALRAQASQTLPLERLLGADCYRLFVAGEFFRPVSAGAAR